MWEEGSASIIQLVERESKLFLKIRYHQRCSKYNHKTALIILESSRESVQHKEERAGIFHM